MEIKKNNVYRHFKGKYVFVIDIVYDSETLEECVIYRHLGEDKTWVRKSSMFIEEISNRNDNITNQKCRFELIELNKEE